MAVLSLRICKKSLLENPKKYLKNFETDLHEGAMMLQLYFAKNYFILKPAQ